MSNPRLSGQTMTRSFITNDNVPPHIKSRLDMSTKLLSLTTKRSNHNILVREFELITWRGGAAWAGDSHTDHQNRRHWHRTSMSFFCPKILPENPTKDFQPPTPKFESPCDNTNKRHPQMCEFKLQCREEGMDVITNYLTISFIIISSLRLAFRPHLLMCADLKTSSSNQM